MFDDDNGGGGEYGDDDERVDGPSDMFNIYTYYRYCIVGIYYPQLVDSDCCIHLSYIQGVRICIYYPLYLDNLLLLCIPVR